MIYFIHQIGWVSVFHGSDCKARLRGVPGKSPGFPQLDSQIFYTKEGLRGFSTKITRRFLPLHIGRFSNVYRIKFVTQETYNDFLILVET